MTAAEFMIRIPYAELVERIALAELRSKERADAAARQKAMRH